MGLSFYIPDSTPPPVFLDNMDYLLTDAWNLSGDVDFQAFEDGEWKRIIHPWENTGDFIALSGFNNHRISGEFTVEVDFNITGIVDTGESESFLPNFNFYVLEPVKGGARLDMKVAALNSTSLRFIIYEDVAGEQLGAIINSTTLTSKFKMTKNANDTVTCWVWDNSQWEWDGNTAGYTSTTLIDVPVPMVAGFSCGYPSYGYLTGGVERVWVSSGIYAEI